MEKKENTEKSISRTDFVQYYIFKNDSAMKQEIGEVFKPRRELIYKNGYTWCCLQNRAASFLFWINYLLD